MAPFQMKSLYTNLDNDSVDNFEAESDFEIDSDISDADLQELRRELRQLEPEKVQRELADANLALQKANMATWIRCCSKPLNTSLGIERRRLQIRIKALTIQAEREAKSMYRSDQTRPEARSGMVELRSGLVQTACQDCCE
ncbi:hypothetical protein MMC32_003426 [Xylographa parallela]|nr:hypothetical protein [Xylographa parallela]